MDDIIIKNLTNVVLPFTFDEIIIATKKLRDAYIIRQAHHGVIYKVEFILSGVSIVVKMIEALNMTTILVHNNFWNEVETMGNAEH